MSDLLPKTAIPFILNHQLKLWLDDYYSCLRNLDRINGKVQWTQEAVNSLDLIHDSIPEALTESFNYYDLTTRKPL